MQLGQGERDGRNWFPFGKNRALLARISRAKALLRDPAPKPRPIKQDAIIHKISVFILPWRIEEYPGLDRWLGHLLGLGRVPASSVRRQTHPSPKHCRRVLAWLDEYLGQLTKLRAELEAYTVAREAEVGEAVLKGRRREHIMRVQAKSVEARRARKGQAESRDRD